MTRLSVEQLALTFGSTRGGNPGEYQFEQSEQYPPYLASIPRKHRMFLFDIFNFTALSETVATLLFGSPSSPSMQSLNQIVARNRELHTKSRESARSGSPEFKPDMHFNKNIGLRDDWYTDAAFGQQQFTGTNATTITLAPQRGIEEFKVVSNTQQRTDVSKLLTDDPASIYIQDYSDFRSAMGVSPTTEFMTDGRYGCSSVVLFRLEPEGKLHPLAITIDHKGSLEESVTIFNRRISSATPGNEAGDWPGATRKCALSLPTGFVTRVSIHLVNTHLVEEVIIVAVNRTFGPSHIVFRLLEPHWNTTLPLNAAARKTLVPKIIIPLTGFSPKQTYAFLKEAYNTFDWTGLYIPNDLRRRGFPPEDLGKRKYHNYGYARGISRMWDIIRKFVQTVLQESYPGGDAQVANDRSISAFYQEVRSRSGGQLSSFPDIKTLDELIDFVTMCIHIASPQHTAVNLPAAILPNLHSQPTISSLQSPSTIFSRTSEVQRR